MGIDLLTLKKAKAYTDESAGVSVKRFGAKGDGVTDDLAAIQAAIDTVSMMGGGKVFIPPSDDYYMVSGAIKIPDNIILQGAGRKSAIFLMDGSNTDVITNADWENGNANIVIRDLYLHGNRTKQNHSGAQYEPGMSLITLVNVRGALIENVHGTSPYFHGIDCSNRNPWSSDPEYGPGCRDIIIHACTVEDFGDDGFTCHNSRRITYSQCIAKNSAKTWTSNSNGFEVDDGMYDVTFTGCIAENCQSGFQVKGHSNVNPPTRAGKNVSFSGCHAYDCHIGFNLGHTDSGFFDYVEGISISGCVTVRCDRFALVSKSRDVTITGGIYIGEGTQNLSPISVTNQSQNVIITGMTFRNTIADYGAVAIGGGVSHITVANCLFDGCSAAVFVRSSNHCKIQNNTILNSGPDRRNLGAITLDADNYQSGGDCSHNIVSGNVIRGVNRAGIYVRGYASERQAAFNIISDNQIEGMARYGIVLYRYASNNVVSNNLLIGNGTEAADTYAQIQIDNNSNDNNVQNNTCRLGDGSPSYGVNVASVDCLRNRITNNDLRDSGTQGGLNDGGTDTVTDPGNSEAQTTE